MYESNINLIDTWSPVILMEDTQVTNYYANVSNSEFKGVAWEFPCASNLPTLSFSIGPSEYATIPAKYLILVPTDTTSESFGSSSKVILLKTYLTFK
jgi:aspergillopepsin I